MCRYWAGSAARVSSARDRSNTLRTIPISSGNSSTSAECLTNVRTIHACAMIVWQRATACAGESVISISTSHLRRQPLFCFLDELPGARIVLIQFHDSFPDLSGVSGVPLLDQRGGAHQGPGEQAIAVVHLGELAANSLQEPGGDFEEPCLLLVPFQERLQGCQGPLGP